MPYNPNIHHRRNIRLKGYDYSQAGLYFITICVQDRKCLFGNIMNGEMILNDAGKRTDNEWGKLPGRFINVQLHEYIVMPNHFHAIMEIVGATLVVDQNTHDNIVDNDDQENGQPQGIAPTAKPKTVGEIVGGISIYRNGGIHSWRETIGLATIHREIVATQLLGTRHS